MTSVTLLGFALPESEMSDILRDDPAMPIQTHSFAWAVVRALRSAAVPVSLESAAPVSNYPRYRRLIFRSRPFLVDDVPGRSIAFVNLVGLKHLTRFVSCLRRAGAGGQVRLVHGVHSPFLWCATASRRMHGVPFVVILTDPPGVGLPTDGRLVALLRRIDRRLVRRALSHADAVVALTPGLAADFAPGRPMLVMEGIADVPPTTARAASTADAPRLVYAGGLTRGNGIDRLVQAVDIAATPSRLTLFGDGELSGWIGGRDDAGGRVGRPRRATRAEVREAYGQADLLVQPRPVTHPAAAHSFPSKLLEYLVSGTPVLSTRLGGIPSAYDPFVYWIEDDSAAGIAAALDDVLARPVAERIAFGRAAAEFARDRCGVAAQGARLGAFLTEIAARANR